MIQTRASASLLLSLVKLMAKITVYPSFKTVIDQKVDIFVSNLPSNQDILLRARTIDDSETVFESVAHYKADENGEVSLLSQPSLGGSYTGVEPMGLFWSMEPPGGTDRDDMLRKRDVTKPLKVSLDVYSGVRIGGNNAGSLEENNKLASVTLLRSYMSDGVTRHVVESGGFYGTLFIPSGEGPYPGIVQLSVSATKKYSKNPHTRTPTFGVQADWVLIYRVR